MSTLPPEKPPTPPTPPAPDAPPAPDEAEGETKKVQPVMTLEELRAAGILIDVPFESGSSKPARLKYADLPGKEYTGPSDIVIPPET
jgi:hypothetical protein